MILTADPDTQRALVLARTLEQRVLRVTMGLQEAAERAAHMCAQRRAAQPDAPDADEWRAREHYWRAASERCRQAVAAGHIGGDAAGADVPAVSRHHDPAPTTSAPPARSARAEEAATALADIVIRALYVTGLELNAVMSTAPEALAGRLGDIVENIDACIREVRHVIIDLRD